MSQLSNYSFFDFLFHTIVSPPNRFSFTWVCVLYPNFDRQSATVQMSAGTIYCIGSSTPYHDVFNDIRLAHNTAFLHHDVFIIYFTIFYLIFYFFMVE
ncbi:MAG: hypothetical protein Q4A29_07750 [Eubacteriales bacterium]|nr:hypothetical protein [Eubacteriales bacterium]